MANIQENIGARNGYAEGMDATTVPIKLRVLLEDSDYTTLPDGTRITPNPLHIVQLQKTNAGHTFYRGAPHPWDSYAVAQRWTVDDQKAPGHFIVGVHFTRFDTPFYGPTDKHWLISIRGTAINQHIKTARRVLPSGELSDRVEPVGMPKYLPVGHWEASAPDDATHQATVYGTDAEPHTQWLREISQHDDQGADVDLPGLLVTFKRTARHFSILSAAGLSYVAKSVNSKPFRGADRYHVMLDDLTIDPISMDLVGAGVPGRAWAITVVFLWSSIPLYPFTRVSQYPGDDGYLSLVYDKDANMNTGAPTSRSWALGNLQDHEALMDTLAML